MRTLTVYGWTGYREGAQTREIVAACSKAEVARLAGYARPTQMQSLEATANEGEMLQALGEAGTIYHRPLHAHGAPWRSASE